MYVVNWPFHRRGPRYAQSTMDSIISWTGGETRILPWTGIQLCDYAIRDDNFKAECDSELVYCIQCDRLRSSHHG